MSVYLLSRRAMNCMRRTAALNVKCASLIYGRKCQIWANKMHRPHFFRGLCLSFSPRIWRAFCATLRFIAVKLKQLNPSASGKLRDFLSPGESRDRRRSEMWSWKCERKCSAPLIVFSIAMTCHSSVCNQLQSTRHRNSFDIFFSSLFRRRLQHLQLGLSRLWNSLQPFKLSGREEIEIEVRAVDRRVKLDYNMLRDRQLRGERNRTKDGENTNAINTTIDFEIFFGGFRPGTIFVWTCATLCSSIFRRRWAERAAWSRSAHVSHRKRLWALHNFTN